MHLSEQMPSLLTNNEKVKDLGTVANDFNNFFLTTTESICIYVCMWMTSDSPWKYNCLPSCETMGFPASANFELKISVNTLMWSAKNGIFKSS
jgi:hypothetical protein